MTMLRGSFFAYICLMVLNVTLRGGADWGPEYTVSAGWIDAICRTCGSMVALHPSSTSGLVWDVQSTEQGSTTSSQAIHWAANGLFWLFGFQAGCLGFVGPACNVCEASEGLKCTRLIICGGVHLLWIA